MTEQDSESKPYGLLPLKEVDNSAEQALKLESLPDAYKSSNIISLLVNQSKLGLPLTALFTDIDNSWVRDGKQAVSTHLDRVTRMKNIPKIAVTGNDLKGVIERIETGELPWYEAIVGSVGTEIWVLHQDPKTGRKHYVRDEFFNEKLIETKFSENRVIYVQAMKDFIKEVSTTDPEKKFNFQTDIEEQFLAIQTLPEPKTEEEKNEQEEKKKAVMNKIQPFKISGYFFANSAEEAEKFGKEIGAKFSEQGTIVCEELGYNKGLKPGELPKRYCIDVAPITKAGATNHLVNLLGIEQGVAIGDSGNDTKFLLTTKNLMALLVGQAREEAIQTIDRHTVDTGDGTWTTVKDENGNLKTCYREQNEALAGPESIENAIKEIAKKLAESENDPVMKNYYEGVYRLLESRLAALSN